MELFIWNVALVLTAYGWIRFCDWKLRPWLKQRKHEAELRQEGEYLLMKAQIAALGPMCQADERLIMRAKGFK